MEPNWSTSEYYISAESRFIGMDGQGRSELDLDILGAIARAEKLCSSYVTRTLRLTLLAPDIVEAILEGRVDRVGVLQRLEKGVPVAWEEQRRLVGDLHVAHRSGQHEEG